MAVELPPSAYDFDLEIPPGHHGDLVVGGADLEPETLLDAYAHGFFPMGMGQGGGPPMGWWSPDPRGVLLPGGHHVSHSLRRSRRRFEVTIDTCFDQVVAGCADPTRDGAWISPAIQNAYSRLHQLGWAHSVEVWSAEGQLVGGLYGVCIGGLFAGESMFHRQTDASKVALWSAVDLVFDDRGGRRLFDVQWSTPHLVSQGVRDVSRRKYQELLAFALTQDSPAAFS